MLRQLSYEEVELHDNEHDCWVILGPSGLKKVYDLTTFLDDHPGGAELLLDLAGMDVQDEFENATTDCDECLALLGHWPFSCGVRDAAGALHRRAKGGPRGASAARKYERRSLLLMQSPVMDKLYADNKGRQPRSPQQQRRR